MAHSDQRICLLILDPDGSLHCRWLLQNDLLYKPPSCQCVARIVELDIVLIPSEIQHVGLLQLRSREIEGERERE